MSYFLGSQKMAGIIRCMVGLTARFHCSRFNFFSLKAYYVIAYTQDINRSHPFVAAPLAMVLKAMGMYLLMLSLSTCFRPRANVKHLGKAESNWAWKMHTLFNARRSPGLPRSTPPSHGKIFAKSYSITHIHFC